MRSVPPFYVLALASLVAAGSVASGQKKGDCDVKAPTDSSCAPAPKPAPATPPPPPAAQNFPYPGEAPEHTGPEGGAGTPASKQFPYPGAEGGTPDAAAGSSSSSSSSSESSSSSSSTPSAGEGGSSAAADPDDPLDPGNNTQQPPGRRKLPKVKELQSPDDREAEDVKVAGFYFDQGNNLAAYNRLKDAVKLIADDADAWYLLGKTSAKLNKQDESLEAFRRFLSLETGTRRAKALTKERPELRAAR